jgi:indole-3-glycerol phosphate synthase
MNEPSEVTGVRPLSQAIAEGDGISIIVHVADSAAAAAAEAQGAEGLALLGAIDGVRAATSLPLLWCAPGIPQDAVAAGADAWRLVVEHVDEDELEGLQAAANELDVECVVDVRDEEELRLALERLDPEIFLLSSRDAHDDEDPLDRVLALLPDVPAGKLAIADVPVEARDDVVALERAGIDGVIVHAVDVGELVGETSPEV